MPPLPTGLPQDEIDLYFSDPHKYWLLGQVIQDPSLVPLYLQAQLEDWRKSKRRGSKDTAMDTLLRKIAEKKRIRFITPGEKFGRKNSPKLVREDNRAKPLMGSQIFPLEPEDDDEE